MAPREREIRRDSLHELEDQLMALSQRLDEGRRREEDTIDEEDKNGLFASSTHSRGDISCVSSLGDWTDDEEDDEDDDNDTFASSWRSGVDLLGDDTDDESIATTKSQALLKLKQARTSATTLLNLEKLKLSDDASGSAGGGQFVRRGSMLQSIPRPTRRGSFLPTNAVSA